MSSQNHQAMASSQDIQTLSMQNVPQQRKPSSPAPHIGLRDEAARRAKQQLLRPSSRLQRFGMGPAPGSSRSTRLPSWVLRSTKAGRSVPSTLALAAEMSVDSAAGSGNASRNGARHCSCSLMSARLAGGQRASVGRAGKLCAS